MCIGQLERNGEKELFKANLDVLNALIDCANKLIHKKNERRNNIEKNRVDAPDITSKTQSRIFRNQF